MFPGNMTRRAARHAFVAHFWTERYIRQIKYIFCAAYVDFVRCIITVVSSLKSHFLLSFVYVKILKCENNSCWQKLEHTFLVKLKVCELQV